MLVCIRARELLSTDSGRSKDPETEIQKLNELKDELATKVDKIDQSSSAYGIKHDVAEIKDVIMHLHSRIEAWNNAELINNHPYKLRKQVFFFNFLKFHQKIRNNYMRDTKRS